MIFRALNSQGDWLWGQGVGGYATGNDAIGLNIETRIRSGRETVFSVRTILSIGFRCWMWGRRTIWSKL